MKMPRKSWSQERSPKRILVAGHKILIVPETTSFHSFLFALLLSFISSLPWRTCATALQHSCLLASVCACLFRTECNHANHFFCSALFHCLSWQFASSAACFANNLTFTVAFWQNHEDCKMSCHCWFCKNTPGSSQLLQCCCC